MSEVLLRHSEFLATTADPIAKLAQEGRRRDRLLRHFTIAPELLICID
jgi:hypothetical protein